MPPLPDEHAAISAAQRDWFNRADRWERESMEAVFSAAWQARGEYEARRAERMQVALTVATDALFEISARPLSTSNAETAKWALEQLSALAGPAPAPDGEARS